MGLKLEIVWIAAILVIVTGAMMLKVDTNAVTNATHTKELEFTNTTFTEVDTEKLMGRVYSTYGIRESGELHMENLAYFTDTIKYLIADKGKLAGDVLQLDGNIAFEEKQGYNYRTQQASYDQKTEILNVTAPFIGSNGKNIIKGDTLVYNTLTKDIYATTIEAVIYTAEK